MTRMKPVRDLRVTDPEVKALMRRDETDARRDKAAATDGKLCRKDAIARARWRRLTGATP